MTKAEQLRAVLQGLPAAAWEPYLLAHSNLPGPRGNLELAEAAADLGAAAQFHRWAALGPDVAPENTPECFLAFCGVVGLGATLARDAGRGGSCAHSTGRPQEGRPQGSPLPMLRALAADSRWRIREAVAMALQRWGDVDMDGLLAAMAEWAAGSPWEQRAAAAGLCEPRLLKDPTQAASVLRVLDEITMRIANASDRKSDAFKTLRQGLAYCWSVAVVAQPETGKPLMEKWLASSDPDVRWIMRENLKKNRLEKMDAAWTHHYLYT